MKVVKKLENTFTLLSNGAIEEFFTFVMSETKLGKNQILPAATRVTFEPILGNIAALYKNTPSNKQAHVLSLVANEFSFKDLISMGFSITQSQFEWAQKVNKSGKASMFPYKRTMPASKSKTCPEKQEQVVEVLLENSSISCRTSKKDPKNNIKNKNYDKEIVYTLNKTKKKYI